MNLQDCLFCRIIEGAVHAHRVYETESHLAFLDIFPSVRGQTLVVPKKHRGSYIFEMDREEYAALMNVSREVARRLDKGLGAIRTCMVMEGMEIDHAHIKLYPVHKIISKVAEGSIDLNEYRGFISTLHGKRATESDLAQIAEQIRLLEN